MCLKVAHIGTVNVQDYSENGIKACMILNSRVENES